MSVSFSEVSALILPPPGLNRAQSSRAATTPGGTEPPPPPLAKSHTGSWHQLGSAYVHRARVADHASGRQCALPHLLCLQRPAPRQQRIAARAHHPRHVPEQRRRPLYLPDHARDPWLQIHSPRTTKNVPLLRGHNVLEAA